MSLTSNLGNIGHAWVCDGIKDYSAKRDYFVEFLVNSGGNYRYSSYGVGSPANPLSIQGGPVINYYNMNWGWGGSSDGWFVNNAFPLNHTYHKEEQTFISGLKNKLNYEDNKIDNFISFSNNV